MFGLTMISGLGLILSLLLFAACGNSQGYVVKTEQCTVAKSGHVTTITCPDGTTASVTDGQDSPVTDPVTEIVMYHDDDEESDDCEARCGACHCSCHHEDHD